MSYGLGVLLHIPWEHLLGKLVLITFSQAERLLVSIAADGTTWRIAWGSRVRFLLLRILWFFALVCPCKWDLFFC